MKHDILGNMRKDKDRSGDSLATVQYCSLTIKIRLIPDGEPLETTVNLAAEVVKRLPKLDKVAKSLIVAELHEAYNFGWNEYLEVQNDGSAKTVKNPKLSATEFEKKFSLSAIHVEGSEGVDFFYDDSGLFSGHRVVVSSASGADFSGADAQLFG